MKPRIQLLKANFFWPRAYWTHTASNVPAWDEAAAKFCYRLNLKLGMSPF
jgi:hypothetical protein